MHPLGEPLVVQRDIDELRPAEFPPYSVSLAGCTFFRVESREKTLNIDLRMVKEISLVPTKVNHEIPDAESLSYADIIRRRR